ncbi:MAG: hypothetical protein QM681_19720 [Novosphingobium sp.]
MNQDDSMTNQRDAAEAVGGALASAVGCAGAVLAAHADKLPIPEHAKALAARCQEASLALASLPAATEQKPIDPELIARVEYVANATGKDRWKIANLTGYDWRRILAALKAASDQEKLAKWFDISTYPEGTRAMFWMPNGEKGNGGMEYGVAYRDDDGVVRSAWTDGGPNSGSDFTFHEPPTMWQEAPFPPVSSLDQVTYTEDGVVSAHAHAPFYYTNGNGRHRVECYKETRTRVHWNVDSGSFSVADDGGWLPGFYPSESMALAAAAVGYTDLQAWWDSIIATRLDDQEKLVGELVAELQRAADRLVPRCYGGWHRDVAALITRARQNGGEG